MSNEAKVSKPFARPATLQDCIELSNTMREEDRKEIWHSSRSSPLNALIDGLQFSTKCWTVEWQGRVVAMFGISPQDELVGVPWMLASDDLKRIRKSFLKECRVYLKEMSKGFQLLTNSAWSQNDVHIQWLKWLGFKFLRAKPMGYDNELFYEFYGVIQDV